jgi:hypothetical protein
MSRLLDDLLDVSHITRGKLELKKSSTELTSVVGAEIEAARPMSDAKHHTVALELPNQPVRLEADLVRLAPNAKRPIIQITSTPPEEIKQTVHCISRGYENVFRWLAEKWQTLGTFDLATMSEEESTYFIDAVELVLKRLVP